MIAISEEVLLLVITRVGKNDRLKGSHVALHRWRCGHRTVRESLRYCQKQESYNQRRDGLLSFRSFCTKHTFDIFRFYECLARYVTSFHEVDPLSFQSILSSPVSPVSPILTT